MRQRVGGVEGIDRLRSQRTPPTSLAWRCRKACWCGADRAVQLDTGLRQDSPAVPPAVWLAAEGGRAC